MSNWDVCYKGELIYMSRDGVAIAFTKAETENLVFQLEAVLQDMEIEQAIKLSKRDSRK